jgi:hypothetical protein
LQGLAQVVEAAEVDVFPAQGLQTVTEALELLRYRLLEAPADDDNLLVGGLGCGGAGACGGDCGGSEREKVERSSHWLASCSCSSRRKSGRRA